MNVTEIVTQNIARTEGVSATDADNSPRRDKNIEWLVEVANDFILSAEWTWIYREAAIVVAVGEKSAAVPADFHTFGQHGGLYLASNGKPLDYKTPSKIKALQQRAASSGEPEMFSIFGFTTDYTNFLERIQFPQLGGGFTVNALYRATLPVLGETVAVDDDPGTVNNIKFIPEKYHQWVLMTGMRALARSAVGDGKGNPLELDPAYQRAKKAAIATDIKGKEQGFQMPSIFESEEQ